MKDKDEILVAKGESEYDDEIKKKKMMRIIIFSIIALVIIAIIVTLFLVLRDSYDKDKSNSDSKNDDLKPKTLMTDSDFIKPKSISKTYELIEIQENKGGSELCGYSWARLYAHFEVQGGIPDIRHGISDTSLRNGIAWSLSYDLAIEHPKQSVYSD